MNKAVTAVVAVIGVAIAAGAGYWAGTRQPPVTTTAGAAAPASGRGGQGGGGAIAVEAMKVMTASMPQTITAVGSLRSDESVVLRPEVAGRVSAIMFKEGQRVSKGMPLVRLDTAINDADVKQAHANYTLAKSKY